MAPEKTDLSDKRGPPQRLPLPYELAVAQVKDYAIYVVDEKGRAASWNEGVRNVLGWDEAEWIGQPAYVLFPPEDTAAAERELETARSEGLANNDRWLVRRDGTLFFAYGTTTAIYGDGRIVGFLKVLRDRTLEHEREEALAQERERLSLALEAANAIAWDRDLKSGYTTRVGKILQVYGLKSGPTEDFLNLVHPEDRPRVLAAINEALHGSGNYSAEFRLTAPDDSIHWVSDRGRVLLDHGGRRRMIGVTADITDRVRAEELLRKADRRKDEFLATLAHELRNPLAPIRTGLQIMQRSLNNPEMLERTRAMMERQLGYIVHLIEDLMDVSRITQNKLQLRRQPLTLATVITSAIETARATIDAHGHTLTVELPEQPIALYGDLTRLVQVFTNLLLNAAKFTERGGQITLRAQVEGQWVDVSITDTGIGLTPEALSEVFEMFSQVKQSAYAPTGLGIGLALARALVELHGGSIQASSPGPGRGSTFVVRLPVQDAQSGTSGVHVRAAAAASTTRRRILVVDDNADSAESLATLLRISHHEVRTAQDGVEALEIAEAFRPQIVLLDIGMPRMDGLELARRLRQTPWGASMFLIAMTGWGQEADRERSRLAGIEHHLVKPVDPHVVEELLESYGRAGSAQ